MMGCNDIQGMKVQPGTAQMSSELAEDIEQLNKEWRERRDSYRNSNAKQTENTSANRASPELKGPSAPLAPTLDRQERHVLGPAAVSDNGLAQAAACGRVEECQRLLARTDPSIWGPDGTTPLCAAALWGHADVVRLLIEAQADPSQVNRGGLRPTALHAAALQENGKICMMLLNAGADPQAKDGGGVAPIDYAACSEAVWPQFAAFGCSRPAKEDLVNKGVIRKASPALELELEGLAADANAGFPAAAAERGDGGPGNTGLIQEFTRPGSAYVMTEKHPPRPGSAIPSNFKSSGSFQSGSRPGSRSGYRRPSSRAIDILAEGGEAGESIATPTMFSAPPSNRPPSGTAKSIGALRSLGL